MRFPESWSSTSLANKAVLAHRPRYLCLDNAFALIEGHPPEDYLWSSFRHYACAEASAVEIESQWTARKRDQAGRSPTGNPRPSEAWTGHPRE
jgi:hypothetical protein